MYLIEEKEEIRLFTSVCLYSSRSFKEKKMSSDEDDYMSDKFLQNAEKDAPAVPILRRNADKRALEILKRKKEIEEKLKQKRKSMKVVEQEKREEGLSSAISSDNKGSFMFLFTF